MLIRVIHSVFLGQESNCEISLVAENFDYTIACKLFNWMVIIVLNLRRLRILVNVFTKCIS